LQTRERVASTNDEAKRLAAAGAPEGALVWAWQQTAGRGRHGREWISEPGNLFCSLVLRPECDALTASQLSFVTAVAVRDALGKCAAAAGPYCTKWPNDVLVNRHKIAGILLESQPHADGALDWLVVGVGVNIASFPAETEWPATSLRAQGGGAAGVDEVLEAFAEGFEAWYGRWRADGFAPARDAWLETAAGLGERIEVRLPGRTLRGRFDTLDATGALVLQTADGECHKISAGTIFFPDPNAA
jgi:BirA family biotin operon repressor/biotin-[acetyl-CoA-carboxylase] ligase